MSGHRFNALCLVALLALAGCGGESADESLVTIEKEWNSSIVSARNQAVYTQAELDALWALHRPGQAAPRIDFDRDMVIAAFHGAAGTPGYDIEIVSATVGNGALNVAMRAYFPGPTCGGTMVIYTPFHIVRRARSDKPVVFSSTSVQSC